MQEPDELPRSSLLQLVDTYNSQGQNPITNCGILQNLVAHVELELPPVVDRSLAPSSQRESWPTLLLGFFGGRTSKFVASEFAVSFPAGLGA